MAELMTGSICLNDIPTHKITATNNGSRYINFVISEMKQPDKWGNTHTIYLTQSKEERGSKVDRIYIGKAKVWEKPTPKKPSPKMPIEGGDFPQDLGFDL